MFRLVSVVMHRRYWMQTYSLPPPTDLFEYGMMGNDRNLQWVTLFSSAENISNDGLRLRLDAWSLRDAQTVATSVTEALAYAFGKKLEHSSFSSLLIQELKDEAIITESEWKRLAVLQMVLDGLDVKISEYGGNLRLDDMSSFIEYCSIMKEVMRRHSVYAGMTRAYAVSTIANWENVNEPNSNPKSSTSGSTTASPLEVV